MITNANERSLTPFSALSPDAVLDALQALGLEPDGRLFALNSYENRVYQVGTSDRGLLVVKFYRPARWSDAQIEEEHEFALELAAAELAVAAPLRFDGRTLLRHEGYRLAVFPRLAARSAELDAQGALELIGRTLGRIHARGALSDFQHRPRLTIERFGHAARETVLNTGFMADYLAERYAVVSERLLERIEQGFEWAGPYGSIRLHGDCHLGNILWDEHGPVFVDLDDCMTGPRVQDMWMFLSGSLDERRAQWQQLVSGYRRFASIDDAELGLIEPLRALRMLHHAAWIASRWADPAFPRAFPSVATPRFWEEHVNDLASQCDVLDSPSALA